MHGPFQFHGNALMYYFFGVSDATSRYLAATFGVLTVVLAMLMGPFIGRTGAFLATLLIVASPSFMYFDRFCREDAYMAERDFHHDCLSFSRVSPVSKNQWIFGSRP